MFKNLEKLHGGNVFGVGASGVGGLCQSLLCISFWRGWVKPQAPVSRASVVAFKVSPSLSTESMNANIHFERKSVH